MQLIPIRSDYYGAVKYYLLHATDSADGCAKINDILSTTEDTLFTQTIEARTPGQGNLFGPPQRTPRFSIEDAKTFAYTTVLSHGGMEFVDICAQLALKFGPDLREKDHKRALSELVKEGKLTRPSGELSRRTHFRAVLQNSSY